MTSRFGPHLRRRERAIAIGLAYIHNQLACQAVVAMDGDGKDDPRDIDRLLDEFERSDGEAVVFAERARRSEGLLFRAGYLAFRALHRPLTGHGVKFGNFSVLPAKYLKRLSLSSDL